MKKFCHRVTRRAALLCLLSSGITAAQGVDVTNVPPPRPQFFAGSVMEIDQQHIKVSRVLVGRPTESRTFIVNALTKMNKAAIKLKSKVTVRYRHMPEGDVALEIQLRPVVHTTKVS